MKPEISAGAIERARACETARAVHAMFVDATNSAEDAEDRAVLRVARDILYDRLAEARIDLCSWVTVGLELAGVSLSPWAAA